jgi:hypothetical protein
MTRLSRITDLFLEGTELYLGDDDNTGEPIVVWVNKLNSFEEEEARRDGSAARALRLLELDNDNLEVQQARKEMEAWDVDTLRRSVTLQGAEEDYVLAMDDVQADEEWAKKIEDLRRMGPLMDDQEIPSDDERRVLFNTLNEEYAEALREAMELRQEARMDELEGLSQAELFDKFMESWSNRAAMLEFLKEQKVTQIYYALRDCQAVKGESGKWYHRTCSHARLLPERAAVRGLPESLLDKVVTALEEVSVDRRQAAFSDAPTSSSESLEQPKQQEESTPSIPEETPRVVQSI